jgi:hypothetical protein
MKTVDSVAFLSARASLDPAGLAGIPEEYEAQWMADPSPYDGRVDRLVFEDAQGVAARVAVLRPTDESEALFCFYGRRADLEEATRKDVFSSLRQWLDDQGIASVQGPIEFSTWHPYRFVCEQGESPWFPGEQPMPDYCFSDFLEGGFEECARFASTLVEKLVESIDVGLAMGVDKGLSTLSIDTVTGPDIVEMLPTIYELSTTIFQENYAYSPIEYDEFHALYARIAALDAAVIVAADDEGPVGMAFSYNIGPYGPFVGEEPVLTSVLKTIGVHPRARKQRIGFGVSYLTHKLWLERGFSRIIHAYMKTDNASRAMSAHFGRTLREYALVRWSATE